MVELILRGKIVRPWVGIGLQDLTPELMQSFGLKEKEGALISQLYEGSPAEKAGLKVGDIVIEIDGKEIENSQSVVREVLKKQVGQQVEIVVLRDGKRKTVSIVTNRCPPSPRRKGRITSDAKEWFGLRVTPCHA